MVKRLLQLATVCPPSMSCAIIYLISEISKEKSSLLSLITQPEDHPEIIKDIDEKKKEIALFDDDNFFSAALVENNQNEKDEVDAAVVADDEDAEEKEERGAHGRSHHSDAGDYYDPLKREPLYARAELTCLWEIGALLDHYHPSVSAFAKQLVETGHVTYLGDPLTDFTMSAFLDRFVFKNAKTRVKVPSNFSREARVKSVKDRAAPNSSEFIKIAENRIATEEATARRVMAVSRGLTTSFDNSMDSLRPDDRFFARYFVEKRKREKPRKVKGKDAGDSDDDDDDSSSSSTREPFVSKADKDFAKGDSDDEDSSIERAFKRGDDYAGMEDDDEDDSISGFSDFGKDSEDDGSSFDDEEGSGASGEGGAGGGSRHGFGAIDDDDELSSLGSGDAPRTKATRRSLTDFPSAPRGDGDFGDGSFSDSDLSSSQGKASKKGKKKKSIVSSFAAAEDFEELLEGAGKEHYGIHPKQISWEEGKERGKRKSDRKFTNKRKR